MKTPAPVNTLTLRRIWRHLGPYVRGQSLLLAGAFVTLLAEIIWRLVEPWALKFVVDYVIGGKSMLSLPAGPWLASLDQVTLLTGAALSIVLVTALRAMSEYVNTVSFALAGNAVLNGARAAIRRAPILLLDEVTTGLDKVNESAVLSALEAISAGSATFYITHDPSHVQAGDMVLYLDGGVLREFGQHTSLIAGDSCYARLRLEHGVAPVPRRTGATAEPLSA